MITVEARVALKELTRLGILYMALNAYESVLAGGIEEVVQNLEKFGEGLSVIGVGPHQPERLGDDRLDSRRFVPNDERSEGGATNDNELVDLNEDRKLTPVHRIADHNATEDEDVPNYE